MTFDVTDIKKWTPAQLEARAVHIEAIANKWHANAEYADMLRMEVAALRYAAFQLGLDDFQKQLETTRPARDGIEAQHGLNDIFPGDPYTISTVSHEQLDEWARDVPNVQS